MADNNFNDEARLMEDMSAFRGLLTSVASTPAQSPADIEAAYQNLRPAMTRIVGEEAVPQQYDPGFIESGMIYTNNMQSRVEDLRAMRAVPEASGDIFGTRKGAVFDENNPIDAQFLDANGVPSFNNNNYKEFLRSRGVTSDFIAQLERDSESDLLNLMDRMTPNEQMQVVNTLSVVSNNLAKQQQEVKDPRRLTDKARSDLIAGVTKNEETLRQLADINSAFDEDFLTFKTKGFDSFSKLMDRSGLSGAERKQRIQQKATFDKQVNQLFNVYVKEFAGSAAAKEEVTRQREAIINGSMSPTEFGATLNVMQTNMQKAVDYRLKMLDENRVLTTQQAMGELEQAGALIAIPGTQAEKVGTFGGLDQQAVISKLSTAAQNGSLDHNMAVSAARQFVAAKGQNFDNLPTAKQEQILDLLRNTIITGAR